MKICLVRLSTNFPENNVISKKKKIMKNNEFISLRVKVIMKINGKLQYCLEARDVL